jgi:hypothetical protein
LVACAATKESESTPTVPWQWCGDLVNYDIIRMDDVATEQDATCLSLSELILDKVEHGLERTGADLKTPPSWADKGWRAHRRIPCCHELP